MSRFASFVRELRQRRVVRALLAYGAGVAAVLQGTDMVFAALALPDLAYRIIVIAALAGFPLVATLSWVFDLTPKGLRRTADIPDGSLRESVPVSRYLEMVGAFTVASAIVLFTAGAVSNLRYPASDDGRVGLAIFPLRSLGSAGSEWSEGAADLLATALEGTPSLRIVDPWSLWSPLRPEAGAAARTPDPEEAEALARHVGAHRFLLGSVVPSGAGLEVSFRLYRVGRREPVDAFSLSADSDGLANLVRGAALRVLTRVWGPTRSADVPAELDFDATQSPEALKAYLAAKEAMRRGMVDSANSAIDRSLALDSTFVLGMVAAVEIKSWGLSLRGQPFTGFFEILARAEPLEAGLNEHSRLRLEASRASLRTDGPAAIQAVRRILEFDSLDYGANVGLEYYRRAYGWQVTPPAYGSRELAERVVGLDSLQLPAVAVRAWWAVSMGDSADQRIQLERFSRADTTSLVWQSTVPGLRALLADSASFDWMLPTLTALPRAELVGVFKTIRTGDPSRFRRFLDATIADPDAPEPLLALSARMRLDLAQGWAARVGSSLDADPGTGPPPTWRPTFEMLLVAADLAGMGDRAAAQSSVASLSRYVPVDSALAYFQERPVWAAGWLVGAWQAQFGDTAVARRWVDAIATLPGGGTSEDYRGALQSDIGSRLALRRGDAVAAQALARSAMKLWTIHSDNDVESAPSPLMRLNLALLLRDAGEVEEATALFSSLVPPTTWMGFLTVRARYELGVLAKERGDRQAAAAQLGRVLDILSDPGPAAREWAERARAGFAGLEGT